MTVWRGSSNHRRQTKQRNSWTHPSHSHYNKGVSFGVAGAQLGLGCRLMGSAEAASPAHEFRRSLPREGSMLPWELLPSIVCSKYLPLWEPAVPILLSLFWVQRFPSGEPIYCFLGLYNHSRDIPSKSALVLSTYAPWLQSGPFNSTEQDFVYLVNCLLGSTVGPAWEEENWALPFTFTKIAVLL